MKRRWFMLCLCLLLSLVLCACQDGEQPETTSFDGGTWTRLEDRTLNMQEYAYQSEDTHIPADWTLPAGTVGRSRETCCFTASTRRWSWTRALPWPGIKTEP